MHNQINVKNLKLEKILYKSVLVRFNDANMAKAVSKNFHNGGLSLIVDGAVKANVSENLDVYAEKGKIKGVVSGFAQNVSLAYADDSICKIYVCTDKPEEVTLVTIKYNL